MLKGRELLGLPVVEVVTGERLGEILDLVLDQEGKTVSGLLLTKGSWFHGPQQVPLSAVLHIEAEAVKVESRELIQPLADGCLAATLAGKTVKTSRGVPIGSVQDVVLDDSCRFVTGYEISDGFISDLVSGRTIIQQPNIITQSEDSLVVEDRLEGIWDSES